MDLLSARYIILLGITFASVFILDRISKMNVSFLSTLKDIGPFHIEAHLNRGFILQALSDSSVFTRVVFVLTLYGFIFFAFSLFHALLPAPLKELRLASVIFFGSITGNAFDRASSGSVNDFIRVTVGESNIYFNLADFFMWIGLGLSLYFIFKDETKIWHLKSKRKSYFVYIKYQMWSAFQVAVVALSSTLILILFSYSFFVHAEQMNGRLYLLTAIPLALVFSAITFFSSLLFSHKSAGPIFAFEKYVEALLEGDQREFDLRQGDHHRQLIHLAKKLREKLCVE